VNSGTDTVPEKRQVRIVAKGQYGEFWLDGRNVARNLRGYSLQHRAGQPPEIVVELSANTMVDTVWEGVARVVIGEPPDPGPAAAAFLEAIDARQLENAALARHDLLDGQPHELTRAMLKLLIEWARGDWKGWESPDGVTEQPAVQHALGGRGLQQRSTDRRSAGPACGDRAAGDGGVGAALLDAAGDPDQGPCER
jgi:hypothetical protein